MKSSPKFKIHLGVLRGNNYEAATRPKATKMSISGYFIQYKSLLSIFVPINYTEKYYSLSSTLQVDLYNKTVRQSFHPSVQKHNYLK